MARWWLIGIAIVCGLALLAPALLNPRVAKAATTVVDDFSTSQAWLSAYPDPDIGLPSDVWSSVSGAGILGGERDIRVQSNVNDLEHATRTMWSVVQNGVFETHRQIGTSGIHEIQWDGVDGDGSTLDPTGLGGIDLTGGGTEEAFNLGVAYYNLGAPTAEIAVYTDAGNASSYTVNFIYSFDPLDYIIKFSDFAPTLGAGADFTDVGAITIVVNGTNSGSGPYFDYLQTTELDDEPPVTTASLDGTVGSGGWYTTAVEVTLSTTDNMSGVDETFYRLNGGAWITYSNPFNVSDQGDTTVEFFSTDNEGNTEATKSTSFRIDTVDPVTTASLSGTLGDNGWYTGPVEVTLNRTDATSGISYTNYNAIGGGGVPYSGPFTLSADGEYSVRFFSADQAGNFESFKSVIVKIDQTTPTIAGSADPPANANGWNNTDVTVSFSCSDGTDGSGVDSLTPDTTLTDEGTSQSVDGSCTDLAGHSASDTVDGINIDKTAPAITLTSIETADGQPFVPGPDVWTNQDVTVTFTCTEVGTVLSGIDQNTVGSVTLSTEGGSQTATNTGACTDLAGNSAASASVSNINIDKTAPTVVTGGPYVVNEGGSISLDGGGSTDALSGITSLAWALDGDNQFDDANPASFAGVDGPATIAIALQVTDYAGNVTTVDTTVTVNNLPPEIISVTNDGPPTSGSMVNISVDATDPAGALDPLSYEFDCDNDLSYEVGPQPENSAACDIGVQEGGIIVNVRVTDGDGGEALGSTVISAPTEMCANQYTGLLRYSDGCRDYELTVVLSVDSSVSICVNDYTGVLRYLQRGVCSPSETWLSLPDDGPLAVCISGYTQVMRAVDDIASCQPFEIGHIIGNSSGGSPGPITTR